jgi:hypothetical protein
VQFIFQADFILVASREEIDSTSKWNKALRDHIPDALFKAITKLNASDFRYCWPHYFPIRVDRDNFFQALWLNTKELLSKKAILESTGGSLTPPSALTLVTSEIADTNGQPLIPSERSKFTYVSHKYQVEASSALESLGVKRLSAEDFLNDLSNFITNWSNEFWSMSTRWHSRLSEVLDPLTAKHEQLISSLCFVPLRDRTWIAPQAGPLLFPLASDELAVPNRIGSFIVHSDAADDHMRETLLRKFKAQDASKVEVCRIIIQTHGSKEFNPETVSRADLIHHVAFLYSAGWKLQKPTDTLWVVPEDESRRLSPEVYLDSQDKNSASQVFQKYRAKFPFLHEEYSKIFHTQDHQKWLQENLALDIAPRLVSLHGQTDKFELSDDFQFLINNIPALEVLQLLRAHWKSWRIWIVPTEYQVPKAGTSEPSRERAAEKTPYDKMKAIFSSMMVQCHDGSFAQLGQTCLPRKDVLVALDISEFRNPSAFTKSTFQVLLVPDPDLPDWDILENFGVMVKVEAKYLIRRLEQVKEAGATKEQVSLLYKRIEACAKDEDIGFIK